MSSGDLHIDLLQENITPAKTPKAKVITPSLYVRRGNPAKPPLPEVSSVRMTGTYRPPQDCQDSPLIPVPPPSAHRPRR
ncbi:MAG: hypothetical protein Q9N34_03605 [Aquificota bacterium]|nr:hypothetical protein [Aquificota bacterium]